MNLSELLEENCSKFGEYPLLHFKGKAITNHEFGRSVDRVASGLFESGIKPGDRVTLIMGNSPQLLTCLFACFKLGAWAMPVVLSLRPPELELVMADAEPTAVIAHRLFSEQVRESVKRIGSVHCRVMAGKGPVPEGWMPWEDMIAGSSDRCDSRNCEPDEIALLLYTSGTTGDPKGVMLSHNNLYSNAINTARSQGLDQREVYLLALPLNHSFGISAWLASLVYGMQVILLPRFDPMEVLIGIDKYKVRSTAMVPTMLAFLLDAPDRNKYDLKSLKRIVVGAAPLSLSLRERFERALPEARILEAYGLTEAGPGVSVTRPDTSYRKRSVGQSIDNQQVSIKDGKGNDPGPGEVGEVCTKGPHVMSGYYKREKETAAVIEDGWLHTGDAGYLDEDGYLYLTSRIKDLIIRGGENVYPADVSRVIRQHPAVAEVAVIGVPDEVYGEEVAAVVVVKSGIEVTGPELQEFCKDKLAPFQVPAKIFFTQALPKTPMGKIRKNDLRAQFGGVVVSGGDD